MMKPQPPQPSLTRQTPIQQPAPARGPPGNTSTTNGSLGGTPVSASAPGPSTAASPVLGRLAGASRIRRRGKKVLLPQPPTHQHQEGPRGAVTGHTRGQSAGKGPLPSPVFEGVYNNSKMLHFLTAAVGSTCDVKVKNGTTYKGIFKTLSSKFELVVDAVHRTASEPAGGPRREDIVDTMVFKPSDVMMVHFRNVDFNYATKDKFTDSAIAMNSKVKNGDKEKVLQPWEGGDGNSDDYNLDSDMSNGWDPNEMFKFNEENYGVQTTYDSSLSSYTVPLEKDNSEEYCQRELRAAQLAREIESSAQYQFRIAMENDDGRTEEEKYSSVQRQDSGSDSPSLVAREGTMREGGPRGGVPCSSSRGSRPSIGSLPPWGGPHHPDSSGPSPSPGPEARGINGDPSRMSLKAKRPPRGAKTMSSPRSLPPGETSATVGCMCPPSPKSAAPAPASASCPEPHVGSVVPTASASIPPLSSSMETGAGLIFPSSPKVTAPNDGKELPQKEPGRTLKSPELAQIAGKAPGLQNEQKHDQLKELKNYGTQFELQSSSSPEASLDPFSSCDPKEGGVEAKGKEKEVEGLLTPEPLLSSGSSKTESPPEKEEKLSLSSTGGAEGPEQSQTPQQNQMGSLPGSSSKGDDKEGPVSDQVKKSTLNPNAKEFKPSEHVLSMIKSSSTPTSPGPWTHSTPWIPVLTADQNGMYSPQYIPYVPQIHMGPLVQAPQMYPYPVSNSVPDQQGEYWEAKGSLPPQFSEQHQPPSESPIMQAAATAGPPLVAAIPYSSYIPYNPQQFPGQPTIMQPMASQPVFVRMLQSNPRMLSGSHAQAVISSFTPHYAPADQPTPKVLYAPGHQSHPHHAMQLHAHQLQPATTPTGSQPQSQHVASSPIQHQAGQPPHLGSGQPEQNLYHSGALTGTPPSLPPEPSAPSPQSSLLQPVEVYAIHAYQQMPHGFINMAHATQAQLQTGIIATPPLHPEAPYLPQVMLLHPPQRHGGPPQGFVPQSGVSALSASTPSPYTYIGHSQAPFHPAGELKMVPAFI
ncbi:LOW QUALITY PROTEIN: ataxin-2-like protein [Dromiciops gliroides]|uniref:LOW QUALITY PROTEIN: ataxin-2-like protein n=1 Tax=Dromiciops gliroides TaxID=33562 RepID=UPI001CC7B6A7|nr:LOW QUALITY PROTEIN: ataxin-2-like protein [Dromiciops gliroides]